jgi:hypothetical protein
MMIERLHERKLFTATGLVVEVAERRGRSLCLASRLWARLPLEMSDRRRRAVLVLAAAAVPCP